MDECNVGSVDQAEVGKIAKIVAEEMSLQHVKFVFTGRLRETVAGWET